MSISPIREAVGQLEALGLAGACPTRARRCSSSTSTSSATCSRCGLALESLAVGQEAERFTDADAAAARRRLDRLDELRREGGVAPDDAGATDFHFTLYKASQSSWLVSLIRGVGPLRAIPSRAVLGGGRAAGAPSRAGRAAALPAPSSTIRRAAAQAHYEGLGLAGLFSRPSSTAGILARST